MSRLCVTCSIGLLWGCLIPFSSAEAQLQTAITTPMNSVSDSFYERIGVNFGFNIRSPSGNVFFNQGGFNEAVPPFGGHSPNSDATFGFAVQSKNADFFFNFAAGQGSTRTAVSQTPTVVGMNGLPMTFTDTVQRPFVTSIIPVVGRGAEVTRPPSPLYQRIQNYYQQQRLESLREAAEKHARQAAAEQIAESVVPNDGSSATRGDLSVAELRRRRSAKQAAEKAAHRQEVLALIERGKGAEEAGKRGVAKIYYRMAAKQAEGDLKQKLLAKVKSLSK